MNLYRVVVLLEVEAESEDEACHVAQDECSQSAFEGCLSVTLVQENTRDERPIQ